MVSKESKKKREGGKERRIEEEEEEEKRKKEEASQGMELWDFCMETTLGMDFVWIIRILYGILEKIMSSKPRVC